MKYLWLFNSILSMIILVLLSSCSNNPKNDLLNYLEKKYPDDDFSWESNVLGSEGKSREDYEIIVKSKLISDAEIHVARQKQYGNIVYLDNYLDYYLRNSVSEIVVSTFENELGKCDVYCRPSPDHLTNSSIAYSADEFLKSKPMYIIYTFLPKNTSVIDESKIDSVIKIIKKQEWYGISFCFISTKESKKYEEIPLNILVDENTIDYCNLRYDFNGDNYVIKWSDDHE